MNATRTNWARALPCLLGPWLYLPLVVLLSGYFSPESENVMALVFTALGLLVLAPFIAYLMGWMTSHAFTVLYLVPVGIVMLVMVVMTSD